MVRGSDGGVRFAFELKWARGKHELGWTLWDIYKLVATKEEHRADATYAIVGAPDAYWADETIDACALFGTRSWDSSEVFRRYWRAWHDLLGGGSGRPLRMPSTLITTLIGVAPLPVQPPWSLRAVRLDSGSRETVPFVGGWPRGLLAGDRVATAHPPEPQQRIAGCLLGGAAGDALGAVREVARLDETPPAYGGAELQNPPAESGGMGGITYVTQMSLFTAEGLMRANHRGIAKGISSIPDVLLWAYRRWLRTQGERSPDDAFGMDGWLITVPQLYARRSPDQTCLLALRADSPGRIRRPVNDSRGCAAVVRAAPIGLLHAGDPFRTGCEVAALTHGHPAGYAAAGYLATLISRLLDDAPLWNAAIEALDELKAGSKALPSPDRKRAALCRKAVETALTLATRDNASVESGDLGHGDLADEALAIALYCSLTADSFEDGALRAANRSGESAAAVAITGNVLGAHLGAQAIPSHWIARLELASVIIQLAADLERHRSRENVDQETDEVMPADWDRYPGY